MSEHSISDMKVGELFSPLISLPIHNSYLTYQLVAMTKLIII